MSYPLGVHFGVPHGIGGGIFLPHVIQHNIDSGFYDYAELHESRKNDNNLESIAIAFMEKIWVNWNKLNVPQNLGDFGMNDTHINSFISDTMDLKPALDQNPIPFYGNEIEATLRKLLKG